MSHRFIRLLFLSAFLLSTWVATAADCPDTQPKITGPGAVGTSTNAVQYTTPAVSGHTYSWVVKKLPGMNVVGTSSSNILNHVWSTPGDYVIELSEGVSGSTCDPVVATPLNVSVTPMLAAYYYYEFDATHGCFYNQATFTATGDGHFPPQDPSVTYTWKYRVYNPQGPWLTTNITPGGAPNIVDILFPATPGITYEVNLKVSKTISGTPWEDEITDFIYVDPDRYKPTAVISAVTPPTPNCLYNSYDFSGAGSLPKPAANPDASIKIKYCDWYIDDVLFHHSGDGVTVPPDMTASYLFTAPGLYTIKLKVTNTINCEHYITEQVNVGNTIPYAAFTPSQACVNEIATFTDNSLANTGTITDWYWYWGDGSGTEHFYLPGNPPPVPMTHIFDDLALHMVTLKVINSNGCEHTSIEVPMQAQPSPKAGFTYPSVICEGDIVQFTDMSSPLTGSPIASYYWEFGDPASPSNTSTDQSPTHLFTGAGSYIVSLTVTNQDGCANTKILPVGTPLVVNPHPDIDFSIAQGSTMYDQIFTAIINPAQFVGNNVNWDFGDGTAGFGSPITHTYPGPGSYTITATATDMLSGCTNTEQHDVILGAPPAACFTANPPNQCQNEPILFVPCPPGGLITTEDWNFGDGNTAHFVAPNVPASPTHAYAAAGPYHVVRVVNQGTTLEASFDLWVNIYEAPTAGFIWFSDAAHLHQGNACDGQPVFFQDQSYSNNTPPSTIYQWLWDFGDPLSGVDNTSTLQNPTHIFMSGLASYNVTLKVWENSQSCPSPVTTTTVTINTPIPVEFSYNNNVCVNQSVNFSTDPLVLPPTDYTWLWDFGDGYSSTAPGSVSHLFAGVGNYSVTLTLTDINGCSKSKVHEVTIIPQPVANFNFSSPSCFGTAIQFTDASFVPLPYSDIIVAWAWDFGDGIGTSILQNPSYTYGTFSATGYNVTLIVTTDRGCSQTKTINVQQIAAPEANFEITAGTYSCTLPQSVQFTDLSQTYGGGTILYWYWDFGDPSSGTSNYSTAQNPSHTYSTSGTKTITLKVTNSNYCENTIVKDIQVNELPAPDFSYSATCLDDQTTFTDLTVPHATGILSWTWDFGDGGSSTQTNPVHTFLTAGIHQVVLTVQNSNGCINTITKPVMVSPKPVASFITTSPFCQNAEITFTSQSYVPAGFTSYINNWEWDFGDGNTGTGPVVLHTYTDGAMSHTVILTVTTTDNCTSSTSMVITATAAPIADFTPTGSPCFDQAMTFVDNSQTNGGGTITQWSWNFDDPASGSQNTSNQQSPVHVFKSTGIHDVTLTVTNVNGCASLVKTIQVDVQPKPIAAFTVDNTCLNNLATFTDGSSTGTGTLVTWAWDFGDGGISNLQNPTHLFTTAGVHYVTLTVTNSSGCNHSITNPVEVYPEPVTSFTFTSPTCSGGTVTFTDVSSTGHGYIDIRDWNFGDGNTGTGASVTHTYTTGGIYNVTLTVTTSDGCTGTTQIPVSIQYAPVAEFTHSNTLCLMSPVIFTDASQPNGGGQVIQWSWNFGDPTSGSQNVSSQQNPVHNFVTTGAHTVTLDVYNADGCSNTITHDVNIEDNPIADFTFTSVCEGSPTVFTDASSGGTVGTWAWSFGDGGTASIANPTYTYANPGMYNVTLTVTTTTGCVGVISKQVEVWAPPVAQFTFASPTCSNDSVAFTNLSTTPTSYVKTWVWTFGDGNTQTVDWPANPNVKHLYANGGTYNVTLEVTTNDDCVNEITIPVTVEYRPIANYSVDPGGCAEMPLQFTDLSQPNSGAPITTWLWDFGDPASGTLNTSTLQNPTHPFSSGGTFTVELVVTNGNGCADTISNDIDINVTPVAIFSSDTACIDGLTHFTDESTTASGTSIIAWLWNFGDPASGPDNTSTMQNPTHVYSSPGNKTVVLMVTNSNQCVQDTIIEIIVNPTPVSNFTYTASCVGDSTQFTDLSLAPGSAITSWAWDFGDGGTSTLQNPQHMFTAPGTYNVTLSVHNLAGCTDSVTQQVIARPTPTAVYTYNAYFCPNGKVDFQDQSTASGAAITERFWTFEPGASSTIPNPTYTFSVTDTTYAVSLVVTDAFGCKDTIIDSVYVKPGFLFTFINDTVCHGYTTHFHAVNQTPGDSLYSIYWNFGDPNSGPANTSTLRNPEHTYLQPGSYVATMRAYNSDNCVDSVFRMVTVYDLPQPLFSYNSQPCDSTIYFHDSTSHIGAGSVAKWTWVFGDGSAPVVINAAPGVTGDTSHLYVNVGTYPVTLIIENQSGCVDSVTMDVKRYPCIQALYAYQDTLRCARYNISFADSSLPTALINQWHWNWGDGQDTTYTSHANPVSHTYSDAGTYAVTLRISAAISGTTIRDSITQMVVVHPTPNTYFSNVPVCLEQVTLFKDTSNTYGAGISLWNWNFGDPSSGNQDTSSFKNPSHRFDTAGFYSVKLMTMNQFGCKDSLNKTTRVYGLPVAHFDNTPACQGDPTYFTDLSITSDTTIGFWNWSFGDPSTVQDTSSLQDPSWKYYTTGSYLVKFIVKDNFGCYDTIDSTVVVNITPMSAFTLTDNYQAKQGQVKLNNSTTGASGYIWDFGNGKTSTEENPVIGFTEDGTYIIKLISNNEFECSDTTFYEYKLLFKGLYVPNAFSPTNNTLGVRLFKPIGVNLKQYHVTVFDPWGHLLWESVKLDSQGRPEEGWDGTFNGETMPQGNYFWKITATFVDDTPWTGGDIGQGEYKTMGSVSLIR